MKLLNCVSVLALAAALAASANTASAQSVEAPPAEVVRESEARPNVLVWMLDDLGFAQLSSYGGLVDTPNIDRVAELGLRYTNYHTAPICSASRAALLTGRNPHSVHIGNHAAAARDLPGYDAHIPAAAGTITANLRQEGYVTYAIGKWDHLPSEDVSPAGPFTYWPSGQGFDRFYGFLAADTDNWHPTLLSDNTPIQTPDDPDYHLSADMADQAIAMIEARDVQRHEHPFFMYWATGIAHAPHHAPREWIESYRGRFDTGWDEARARILRAQQQSGVVPQDATLGAVPEGMPAWDSLSAEEQRLFARQMEVFAASLSYTDAQFGRILDALEARGELDDTLIIITSDNGASAEGGPTGLYNEAIITGGPRPSAEENLRFFDAWGGPQTYPHYAYGWAVAGDTPYRYYKQVAHEGGTRVPLVIAWPHGIEARGELRGQFAYVTDIAPTILDAAGVAPAEIVNNVRQSPMEGDSLTPTFASAEADGHDRPQYVELNGNRGLWWQGWYLVATHRTRTWDMAASSTFDEPWELYNLTEDPGQSANLAAEHPERVRRMSQMFEEQAERFNVRPMYNISDIMLEVVQRGARDFQAREGRWRFAGPVSNVPQDLAPPITTRNYVMTANIEPSERRATGPVFAYGGALGGIGLYLVDGKPTLIVNSLDGQSTIVAARRSISAGAHQIQLAFRRAPADAGLSLYEVAISVDGVRVAQDTIGASFPISFGIPATFGIGNDHGSPVLPSYRAGTPFPGEIGGVVFDFN